MENSEHISQFRPIHLSNVVIKIVFKVLANLLKLLMNDLVGHSQASFIHERQTTDNIIVRQELIHSLRRRKGGKGAMIVKIDLEKTYDRMDWEFLEEILREVDFTIRLVQVILNCIKSTHILVIWNGERLQEFQPEGTETGRPVVSLLICLMHGGS